MIGVTRGISTLAGATVAGILLWFATQEIPDLLQTR